MVDPQDQALANPVHKIDHCRIGATGGKKAPISEVVIGLGKPVPSADPKI